MEPELSIVAEASSIEGNIKPTAKKYGIDHAHIRRWLKNKAELADQLQHSGHLKMIQKGRPAKNEQSFESLRANIHKMQPQHRAITVGMLIRELTVADPSEKLTEKHVLRHRMYRFLQNEKMVQRRATHIAQNTRHSQSNIDHFVEYVNEEIQRLGISPDCVVNIDETNLDFDMTGRFTLAGRGSRTVSIQSNGTSARVSVLLGVTMSGIKLKPFLIFNGTPKGKVARELTQLDFPDSCAYTCQKSAWIDEPLSHAGSTKFGSHFVRTSPQLI